MNGVEDEDLFYEVLPDDVLNFQAKHHQIPKKTSFLDGRSSDEMVLEDIMIDPLSAQHSNKSSCDSSLKHHSNKSSLKSSSDPSLKSSSDSSMKSSDSSLKSSSDPSLSKSPGKRSNETIFRRIPTKHPDDEKKGSPKILKFLWGRKTSPRDKDAPVISPTERDANPLLDSILKQHHPVGVITTTYPHKGVKWMNFEVYNCGLLVHASSVTMTLVDDINVVTQSHSTNILINITSQALSYNVCLFDCLTVYKLNNNSRSSAYRCFELTLGKLIKEKNFYALHHYLIVNTLCIGGEILNYSAKEKNINFQLHEMEEYTQFAADNIGEHAEYMIPLIRRKISLLP